MERARILVVMVWLAGVLAGAPAWAAAPGASPAAVPTGPTLAACSWDRPGHNPFMGDVVAAVDRYGDIPPEVRQRLKARMAERSYDDLVSIRRDRITGIRGYEPRITGMHFGAGSVCREVSRERWTDRMEERGLVYCESGHCILVPTVCRNVSRIVERPQARGPALAVGDEEPDALLPGGLLALDDLLDADPPAAGAPAVGAPTGGAQPGSFAGLATSAPGGLSLRAAGPASTPYFGAGALSGGSAEPGRTALPYDGRDTVGIASLLPGLPGVPGGDLPPGEGSRLLPTPVPEPATVALMAAGLGLLALARRRQRRAVPACSTQ